MTDLAEKKCIPCEGGIPNFDITEIHKYLKSMTDILSLNNVEY